MDQMRAKLLAKQEQHSTHMDTKEAIDARLEEAAERKAAIDAAKSEMAGQEVGFAKAVAAEHAGKSSEAMEGVDPKTGLTREDIERDLEAAAERKRKIDEEKSRKAGEEVKHVMEVVENKKRSVEALESEKSQLDAELAAMEAKQKALEQRLST